MDLTTSTTLICLRFSLFQNPSLRNRFLFLYPTTSPELNNNKIWFLSIETETHSENFKIFYSRACLKSHIVFFCFVFLVFWGFFCKFVATRVLLPLLCSTCLISLLNIFWAIQQEMLFMSFLKKNLPNSKEKNRDEVIFGKVVGLHRNLLE